MKTEEEKLNSLTRNSVWRFPKQDTSFDNAFRAVKLFNSISVKDATNIERYFYENYEKFGVTTNRHRVLVIPQMYGLLSKTPFFKRGSTYSSEKPTEVFNLIDTFNPGSDEFNKIKTEQILKIKMRAVIDTTEHCIGWNIYPVIYSYIILKKLKNDFNIQKVPLSRFYSFVMTCQSFNDFEETINILKDSGKSSVYWNQYLDDSRFINILKDNIALFNITDRDISINPVYDEYFNINFIGKHDIHDLNKFMANDRSYANYLYELQDFGINLVDDREILKAKFRTEEEESKNPKINVKTQNDYLEQTKEFVESEIEDIEYIIDVNNVSDKGVYNYLDADAHKTEPANPQMTSTKRYCKNPLIGKSAIVLANYLCENELSHKTFISSTTTNKFMEAHHLIPICFQESFWTNHNTNIDCIENLVSLCPTCHRAIHFATKEEKIKLIESLYDKKKAGFVKIGLNISLEDLIKLYIE